MHQIIGGIVVGTILGKTSAKLRPFFKKAVKGGIIAERKAREFGRSVRSEVDGLVNEAKAELEAESRSAQK